MDAVLAKQPLFSTHSSSDILIWSWAQF